MASNLETARLEEASDLGGGRWSTVYRSPDIPGALFKKLHVPGVESEDQLREVVGPHLAVLQDPEHGMPKYVPPTELVWRPDEGGLYAGFIATREVVGISLPSLERVEEAQAAELDDLFAQAIRMGTHHSNRYDTRQPDLVTMRGALKPNVMVGTIDDGPQQPWQVDAYPALVPAVVPRPIWDQAFHELSEKAAGFPFPEAHAALDEFFDA